MLEDSKAKAIISSEELIEIFLRKIMKNYLNFCAFLKIKMKRIIFLNLIKTNRKYSR